MSCARRAKGSVKLRSPMVLCTYGSGRASYFLIVGGFYSEVALRNEKQRAQCILNTRS